MTIRAHRVAAAGALAAGAMIAVAAPIAIALTSSSSSALAGPPCLAWFGNQEDGVCLSYSNGNGVNVGTPDLGVYGPDSGVGIQTGGLLPGSTITRGIG